MTTGGRLILPLSEPTLTAAGVPSSGATLTVYETGTTTLATIYADAGLATPILNPQTSNSAGRFYEQSTEIWADDSVAYDCILSLPDGEMFSYLGLWLVGPPQSITGYAPINSPAFTGIPTAPTPAANDSSSKIATTQFVQSALALVSIFPTGCVLMFAMSSVPSGWLPFSSTPVSRTTYAALFAAIGTTYGPGDGSTTFNIPPPGYFGRSVNTTMSGPDAGRSLGSIQTDAMQGHYHGPLGSSTGFYGYPSGGGVIQEGGGNATVLAATTGAPVTDGTNGTPRTAVETRPSNIAFVFAIKT